jgi:hypothetical protein
VLVGIAAVDSFAILQLTSLFIHSQAIRTTIGYRTHHKFKRFQQVGGGEHVEMNGLFEMRIEQYFNYLERREAALDGAADSYLVISTPGQPVLELDVVKDVLYMIDLDMPKFLPRTFDDFVSNFKMKEILPGGKWCMMNAVSEAICGTIPQESCPCQLTSLLLLCWLASNLSETFYGS